jgi:hypothetical protein
LSNIQEATVARLNLVDLARYEHLKKTSDYRGHLKREAMVINDKSLTFPRQVLYPLQTQRLASQFPLEYKVGVRIEPTIKWNCDLIRPSLTLF